MAEQFNYSSALSPYIKRMLEIRKSMGIVDSRVRWILKEFDDFANSIGLQEPHITEEFVKRWHKSRISDKEITIYGKYLVLRQLTSLMCRNGCVCYIPINQSNQNRSLHLIYTRMSKYLNCLLLPIAAVCLTNV